MPKSSKINTRCHGNINLAHLYTPTPHWNFGVNARARVFNYILNDSVTSDIVWQPDTYHSAKRYANASGIKRIIDVGCGSALKPMSLFCKENFEVVAVDSAESLIAAKENYPTARHVECDLTSWNELLAAAEMFRDGVPTVILCAEVIEHIPDPRPLLAFIRLLLAQSPDSRCFISTPDRSRLGYRNKTSEPANATHIREWTKLELTNLLMTSGLQVVQIGNIRANIHDEKSSTILVECSFDSTLYGEVLARYGIPFANVSSVMITTEYPGLGASGTIGAFAAGWHRSVANSVVLSTFEFDINRKKDSDFILSPSDIIDLTKIDDIGAPDILLQAVFQLLFICPDIKEIHFQDFLGIGMRIVQAKKAGILPDTITLVVHCHGNQHYLENANHSWSGVDELAIAVKEKISIELSDLIVFSSLFLRNLYIQQGIRIDSDKVLMCPHRYINSSIGSLEFVNIYRIVFVGKFTPMKGVDLFCKAFDKNFCKKLASKGIKEVAFIGSGPNKKYINETAIKNNLKLTMYTEFDHENLVSYIKKHRSDSLFVEPYRGDNFPLAVYDVVGNGGLLLAGNAGGIPEMFRVDVWGSCLVDLSVEALRCKILEMIDWDSSKKIHVVNKLIDDLNRADREIDNTTYTNAARAQFELLSSTVMIPFYNADILEFTDMLKSLNQQSLRPTEIIIVNDGSSYESRSDMEDAVKRHLAIPFRIIDHAHNCGLAAARNTALFACTTDLILNADADDILLNDWVKTIVVALSRDPSAAAAVPYFTSFDAGANFNLSFSKGQYTYRPLGDGFVTSQVWNELGHANSGYRVLHAKGMGGWNATSKAKYEDWAFFLNVIANDLRISIIPSVTCLYRVRKNSMTRTYSEWPGQARLFQTTGGLSRFEALQLQRLSRMALGAYGFVKLQRWLKALENGKIIRLMKAVSAMLKRMQLVWYSLGRIVHVSRKFANRMKRTTRS